MPNVVAVVLDTWYLVLDTKQDLVSQETPHFRLISRTSFVLHSYILYASLAKAASSRHWLLGTS